MELDLELLGLEELIGLLNELDTPRFADHAYGQAGVRVARAAAKEARHGAPVRTGLLRRRLRGKADKTGRSQRVQVAGERRIGLLVGAPHTHLQTLGTVPRRRKKSGGRTGRIRANRFVEKALQSNVTVEAIEDALCRSMAKAIDDLGRTNSAATRSLIG